MLPRDQNLSNGASHNDGSDELPRQWQYLGQVSNSCCSVTNLLFVQITVLQATRNADMRPKVLAESPCRPTEHSMAVALETARKLGSTKHAT